jgi:hypothetical protein
VIAQKRDIAEEGNETKVASNASISATSIMDGVCVATANSNSTATPPEPINCTDRIRSRHLTAKDADQTYPAITKIKMAARTGN